MYNKTCCCLSEYEIRMLPIETLTQGREQITNLLVDLFGGRDSLGNFVPQ